MAWLPRLWEFQMSAGAPRAAAATASGICFAWELEIIMPCVRGAREITGRSLRLGPAESRAESESERVTWQRLGPAADVESMLVETKRSSVPLRQFRVKTQARTFKLSANS